MLTSLGADLPIPRAVARTQGSRVASVCQMLGDTRRHRVLIPEPNGLRAPDGTRGPEGISLVRLQNGSHDAKLGADPFAPLCGLRPRKGWTALAPLAAGPRQETAVVALAGRIYVLGGFTGSLEIVPRVEAYDPGKDSWREVAPLPRALHHTNAAAVGGRLYVLGALVGSSFAAVGDAY